MKAEKWKYELEKWSCRTTGNKIICRSTYKISESVKVVVKKEEVSGHITTGTKSKPYSCQIIRGKTPDPCTLKSKLSVKDVNKYIDNAILLLDFEIKDGILVKYHGSASHVVIPGGVMRIDRYAFSEHRDITSLVIPESVECIEHFAFDYHLPLQDVYYDGTLNDWINIEFRNETSNPMFYANNFYIKDAEGNYTILTDLVIPDDVKEINDYKFMGFKCLKNVTIGDNVTKIGEFAFSGCSGMQKLTIGTKNTPANDIEIGSCTFRYCTALTDIMIYSNLTLDTGYYRYGYPFHSPQSDEYNNIAAAKLTIGDNVTYIGDSVFNGFTNLKTLVIGDSVTRIGSRAFFGCNMATLVIPASVTNIGDHGFSYCGSLETVIMLNKDGTRLERGCFIGCRNLNSSISLGHLFIGDFVFEECSSLLKVVVEGDISHIGFSAFDSCIVLKSINLNGSIQTISSEAFTECESLTTINATSINNVACNSFSGAFRLDGTTMEKIIAAKKSRFLPSRFNFGCSCWDED